MICKPILSILILAILCGSGCTKNENPVAPKVLPYVTFSKIYSEYECYMRAIAPTEDGGCIVVGDEGGSNSNKVQLIRFDKNGIEQWRKYYSGNEYSQLTDITTTSTQGFIMCGTFEQKGWILCVNSTGDILWSKTFTVPFYPHLHKITPAFDGGFICIGGTTDQWQRGLCIKVNEAGDVLFQKNLWDLSINGEFIDLIVMKDNSFVVLSNVEAQGTKNAVRFLYFTSNCELISKKNVFISADALSAVAFEQTGTNGYFIIGNRDDGTTYSSFYIITDSAGTIKYMNDYKASDYTYFESLSKNSQDNFYIAGVYDNSGDRVYSSFIMKVLETGEEQWSKKLDLYNDVDECLYKSTIQSDNSIIAAGTAWGGYNPDHPWIVKLIETSCKQLSVKKK